MQNPTEEPDRLAQEDLASELSYTQRRFFDPDKPSVIFIHGMVPTEFNASNRMISVRGTQPSIRFWLSYWYHYYKEDPSVDDPREYNIGIYDWQAFGSETKDNYWRVEAKVWGGDPGGPRGMLQAGVGDAGGPKEHAEAARAVGRSGGSGHVSHRRS